MINNSVRFFTSWGGEGRGRGFVGSAQPVLSRAGGYLPSSSAADRAFRRGSFWRWHNLEGNTLPNHDPGNWLVKMYPSRTSYTPPDLSCASADRCDRAARTRRAVAPKQQPHVSEPNMFRRRGMLNRGHAIAAHNRSNRDYTKRGTRPTCACPSCRRGRSRPCACGSRSSGGSRAC